MRHTPRIRKTSQVQSTGVATRTRAEHAANAAMISTVRVRPGPDTTGGRTEVDLITGWEPVTGTAPLGHVLVLSAIVLMIG
jgi:hypothetical protein